MKIKDLTNPLPIKTYNPNSEPWFESEINIFKTGQLPKDFNIIDNMERCD